MPYKNPNSPEAIASQKRRKGLAREYGLNPSTLRMAINGKTYAEIV